MTTWAQGFAGSLGRSLHVGFVVDALRLEREIALVTVGADPLALEHS